jgi:hypothetical protein
MVVLKAILESKHYHGFQGPHHILDLHLPTGVIVLHCSIFPLKNSWKKGGGGGLDC